MINLHHAKLEWANTNTPVSTEFGDIYFSRDNGLEESVYTYLNANELPQRWPEHFQNTQQPFVIAETGFGTGLNFLATWQAWHAWTSKPKHAQLHYISIEKYPLSQSDLAQALQAWPDLAHLAPQLLSQYPPAIPGIYRLAVAPDVTLLLILNDATAGFAQLQPYHSPLVNAWYLDGFAPAKNPDMWTDALFQQIARLSAPNASLSSFTAAGFVRRGLQAHGFKMGKRTGFGTKREMLIGRFESSAPIPSKAPPWFSTSADQATQSPKVAIIGGGLAGTSTALALAEAGMCSHLFESMPQLAMQASGNPVGIYAAPINSNHDAISQFYLNSILGLQHWARQYQFDLSTQGCLHLAYSNALEQRYQKLAHHPTLGRLFRWLSSSEIQQDYGIDTPYAGLVLHSAGQTSPAQLCQQMWQHSCTLQPNNQLYCDSHVQALHYAADTAQWQLTLTNGMPVDTFDAVVLCNSHNAKQLVQTADYPLRIARGQLHWTEQAPIYPTPIPICARHYVTANDTQQPQVYGASFVIDNDSLNFSADEQQLIESQLSALFTTPLQIQNAHYRVSQRSVLPDHLPLIGPAVNIEAFQQQYADLHLGKPAWRYAPAPLHPELYLNIGHGSRGLSSCHLAAQLITSLINKTMLPIPADAYMRLHPARFLIKALKTNHNSSTDSKGKS